MKEHRKMILLFYYFFFLLPKLLKYLKGLIPNFCREADHRYDCFNTIRMGQYTFLFSLIFFFPSQRKILRLTCAVKIFVKKKRQVTLADVTSSQKIPSHSLFSHGGNTNRFLYNLLKILCINKHIYDST